MINFVDIIECLNVFEKAGMINKLRKRDKYYQASINGRQMIVPVPLDDTGRVI